MDLDWTMHRLVRRAAPLLFAALLIYPPTCAWVLDVAMERAVDRVERRLDRLMPTGPEPLTARLLHRS